MTNDPLSIIDLSQKSDPAQYYRIAPQFVATDGLKYLMDQAQCYWLAQLYAVYLCDVDYRQRPFTVLNLTRRGAGCIVTIEDGNGAVLASERLSYTDFPLDQYCIYACWSGEMWVGMLPSEY